MTTTQANRTRSRPLCALPEPLRPRPEFLAPGATPAQRIRAAAANHREWFTLCALTGGGEAHRENGVTWTCAPGGGDIAFPRMPVETAGATLDRIVARYRARRPARVSCWSLLPARPRDLGARLTARGFEWGWQPHWMSLDLHALRVDFPLPDGLHIAADDASDWEVNDLPYYSRDEAAALQALARVRPRRVWHFGARQDGQVVGHSLLFVTTGRSGVAGIYSVGVVPAARNRGVGKAVSLAACQFAQALGCHYALLNSAADPLYQRLGFESLGWGQTWWMHAPTLAAPPPTPAQVAFAEAVGRGDVRALDALDRQAIPGDLDAPLPCGMTPMALAVRVRKPASVRWLAARGATLEVLHAWDLGWKSRVPAMLAASPELANRRSGPLQSTPLHEAAARNDIELARLLLAARPDLEIQDTAYHSTPLGWARHFQRTELVALLEAHQKEDVP
jgi:predicted N-acetyltransferase YhbS